MRFVSTLGDVFWAGLMTVVLLIIGFFLLRVIGNLTKATPIGGIVNRVQRAATPAGA